VVNYRAVCRDLSGRTGVHRIAVLDEPGAGGAKVIKLRERAGIDRRVWAG